MAKNTTKTTRQCECYGGTIDQVVERMILNADKITS